MLDVSPANALALAPVSGAGANDDATIGHPSRQPVVLILAPAFRSAEVQALLHQVAPCSRALVACSPTDAAAMLVVGHVDLLLMDLQCEPSQPLATIHLLARLAPAAKVMAFGESNAPPPIHPYHTHAWADLERLVAEMVARWHERRATSRHRLGLPGESA